MWKLIAAARDFARGEEGATMVEYGLMLAFVAAVVVAGATALGTAVNSQFNAIAPTIGGS